jgi:hypothetical protein
VSIGITRFLFDLKTFVAVGSDVWFLQQGNISNLALTLFLMVLFISKYIMLFPPEKWVLQYFAFSCTNHVAKY